MEGWSKLIRIISVGLGAYLGILAGQILTHYFPSTAAINTVYLGLAGALTAFLFNSRLEGAFAKFWDWLMAWLASLQPRRVAAGTVGTIMALLVSTLTNSVLSNAPFYNWFVSVLITGSLLTFFLYFTLHNTEVFGSFFSPTVSSKKSTVSNPKILDTNVIIDGRITDLVSSNFLEGTLIVPVFVLRELQYIADQGDNTKRARGRRGLDTLEALRSMRPLKILDWDAPDLQNVDDKLVRLSKELHGKLVSNDYNLSKVAKLQDVDVLNINELAASLKARYAAGDTISILISKAGQQAGQGVGYLEDGTMVVVEGGAEFRGKTHKVLVLSNIQTAIGRMIFAKIEGKDEA